MKIVIKTDESVKDLTPRDVRNFCGSITDQKYNYIIMYHGRKSPPVIYNKPYNNSINIVFYQNDFYAFSHLVERLEANKDNFFGRKITKVFVKEDGYLPPFYLGNQTISYATRTPVLFAKNDIEFKMMYNAQVKNTIKEFLVSRLKRDLAFQLKNYTGVIQTFDDLKIEFKDFRVFTEKHKIDLEEGSERATAYMANFVSNYQLPEMVGYGNGLGYGQLITNQEVEIKK